MAVKLQEQYSQVDYEIIRKQILDIDIFYYRCIDN